MTIQVQIRKAMKSDLESILTLYSQPDLDDGKTLPLDQAEAIFERMRQYPNYRLYVAEEEGRIVGVFALLIMDNLGHLGVPSAVIEQVAVDPAWQGKGVGTQMMKFAMQECRRAGCYKIALSSNNKRIRAHRFYEKLGFKRHGYSFQVEMQSE